jgi:L-arabinose isomerase
VRLLSQNYLLVPDIGQTFEKPMLLTAESVSGPILQISNTNNRHRFSIGAHGFIEARNAQGPAHHCAIGTDHIANKLKKFGDFIGTETIRIC